MRLKLKRYLPGLNDPNPAFLALPSVRPFQAAREFYAFAYRALQVVPPAIYRTLPHDLSMDMLHDMSLTCIRDEFRVLQEFVPSERPFAHWLRRQFSDICPKWQSQISALATPEKSQPLLQYDENGKVQRLEPLELAQRVRSLIDSCNAEDRLLLELSVFDFRPWEMREITRWTSLPERAVSERRAALRGKLTEELQEADFQLAWDDRQLNQLIRLARTLRTPAKVPAEVAVEALFTELPGEEHRTRVVEAMADSPELALKILDRTVDQWDTFSDELAVEFADIQVGCTPDFAALLTPKTEKASDVKKMWPF